MDGLHCIKIAQNHLDELKKRINEENLEDICSEIQEVMSAMNYLWDWVDAQQDKPR